QLEAQRARDRRRLDEADCDAVAEPMRLAGAIADQRMLVLLVAEIIVAERARRNEPVGAGLVELDEEAGARRAADMALEGGADAVGEEMRDEAVGGLALGRHGAALGRRDARADLAQRRNVSRVRQSAFSEFQRANEPAMHDQV